MNKKVIAVFDVETSHDLGWPLIYDAAIRIIDKRGNVELEKNWIIREVFTNPDLMTSAYYAVKYYTMYPDILMSGNCVMVTWQEFLDDLCNILHDCGVNVFSAYNAAFDIRALRLTDFWQKTGIKYRVTLEREIKLATEKQDYARLELLENPPFPIDFTGKMKVLDIYQACVDNLLKGPKFRQTALENLWITPNGNYTTTAQTAYRYLSGDSGFIEAHTALDDVIIETELLLHCFKQKKRLQYDVLNPACIVARGAQPLEGRYFHERIGKRFTDYLDGQFFKAYSLDYEEFRHLGFQRQWEILLDLEPGSIDDSIDAKGREALKRRFKSRIGVCWSKWIKMPSNFQKIRMLDLAGMPWYVPDDFINPDLPPNMTRRYMEEKSVLDGRLRRKPVTEMSIPELANEVNTNG